MKGEVVLSLWVWPLRRCLRLEKSKEMQVEMTITSNASEEDASKEEETEEDEVGEYIL
jgi:hypothetical protein